MIAAIATLLASIGGLWFSTEQARQAQEGQTSERFSRSVEQLGSSTITVRIGAVYSFARLIRDSSSDKPAVIEILSSFVRLQAAAPAAAVPKRPQYRQPPADLVAALTVLGSQPRPDQAPWSSMLLTLVDLSRFQLSEVQMRYAGPSGADLSGANLAEADLSGASLIFAHLAGADMVGAHLADADLSGADLSGAALNHTNLSGTNLSRATLNDSNLSGAHLANADMAGVICSERTRWPGGVRPAGVRCAPPVGGPPGRLTGQR